MICHELDLRYLSIFLMAGRAGANEGGGDVNNIYARKKEGGHKFMHTHLIREVSGGERERGGGGSAKNVLYKREGQENLNIASLFWHQFVLPTPGYVNCASLKSPITSSPGPRSSSRKVFEDL